MPSILGAHRDTEQKMKILASEHAGDACGASHKQQCIHRSGAHFVSRLTLRTAHFCQPIHFFCSPSVMPPQSEAVRLRRAGELRRGRTLRAASAQRSRQILSRPRHQPRQTTRSRKSIRSSTCTLFPAAERAHSFRSILPLWHAAPSETGAFFRQST
jgi:hypothetical protein